MKEIDHKANSIMFLLQIIEREFLNNIYTFDNFGSDTVQSFSVKTLRKFNEMIELPHIINKEGKKWHHIDNTDPEVKTVTGSVKRSYHEPTFQYKIFYMYDEKSRGSTTLYYAYTVTEGE